MGQLLEPFVRSLLEDPSPFQSYINFFLVGGVFAGSPIGYRGLLLLSFCLSSLLSILASLLHSSPPRCGNAKPLDYIGAAIITTAALLIVFGLVEASRSWNQIQVVAPITVGTATIGLFVLWEELFLAKILAGAEPLIPRRVWSYKNLVPIFVMTGLSFGSFFLLILHGAQFLVKIQGVRNSRPSWLNS